MSYGSTILFTISLEFKSFLNIFESESLGNALINISPSNILTPMLSLEIFHQNCHAAFGCCKHDRAKNW